MVNVRKRGNFYQYQFEVAPINGKRKQVTKSGFETKAEAEKAGIKAYNELADYCYSKLEKSKRVFIYGKISKNNIIVKEIY